MTEDAKIAPGSGNNPCHPFEENSAESAGIDREEILHIFARLRQVLGPSHQDDLARLKEHFHGAHVQAPARPEPVEVPSDQDILFLDREGRFLPEHQAPRGSLFLPPDAFVGRTPAEVMPSVLAVKIENALAALQSNPMTQEFEYELPSAGGMRSWRARINLAQPLTQPIKAGACVFLAQIHEITSERQQLDRLVLSDRLSSMGSLAAGIAHEINNPLSYLILNLDLARARLTPGTTPSAQVVETIRDALDVARDGAERVRIIVRDLRTFARSDEQTGQRLNLNFVLENALTLTTHELEHVELRLQLGPELFVVGNESRLVQVFINLLVNAAQTCADAQLAPRGDKEHRAQTITLTTQLDGARVRITVEDSGEGIAPEYLGKIFDPFFTTKQANRGTGLGLTICHRIITEMGGDITVRSLLGTGSVFQVSLPLAPSAVTESSKPHPMIDRAKILLVDDEPAISLALASALSDHDVTIAASGHDALERIVQRAEHYDVIVCDMMMPEVTGMDVYEGLKRVAPGYEDKMLFTTGGAFTSRARTFLATVTNPRIEKPFGMDELALTITEMLEQARRIASK